jgi:mutual gliding-motility protein MglA
MVFFNYATMQMAAKIVYYGPGLCGKTTNLHTIYGKTSPQSRGEMVSLETETDRTLFFDLLPLDVGVVGGFKTRLQLYTVPGQVFYNTTRKLVLKGVDGIVFVADSQKAMLDANVDSLKNLRENLSEIGLNLDDLPVVIQLNKRDLPNVHDRDTLVAALDPDGKYEFVEASAVSGVGVFETLKLISKLTLRSLRRRMMGDEAKPAAAQPKRPTGPVSGATPRPGGAVFTVHERQGAAPPAPQPPPAQSPAVTQAMPALTEHAAPKVAAQASQPAAAAEVSTAVAEPVVAPQQPPVEMRTIERPLPQEPEVIEELPEASEVTEELPVESEDVFPAEPIAEAQPAAAPEAPMPAPAPVIEAPEPEIQFAQTAEPAKPVEAEIKHVKVRNTNDIMAELEQLRKNATSGSGKGKVDVLSALDALTGTSRPKKESVTKSVALRVPSSTPKQGRTARVTITFEDEQGSVVQKSEQAVELGKSDWTSLQLNVKVDLE